MELRQLRYFTAVARTLNFTRAAKELRIAQPPLSRQISNLEYELETLLIDRDARPMRLTPAGEMFRDQASQILASIERLRRDTRVLGRTGQRTFRIGLEASTLYGRFPELVRGLRDHNPRVRIAVVQLAPADQITGLKEGKIDVGVSRMRLPDDSLEQVVLREEPLLVAIPPGHPLAIDPGEPLRLADLAAETLVLFSVGPPPQFRHPLNELFDRHGFQPQDTIETGELQAALGLVAAGSGVCVVPAVAQRMRREDVHYRRLDEAGAVSPVVMAYVPDHESDLIQSIHDVLAGIPEA